MFRANKYLMLVILIIASVAQVYAKDLTINDQLELATYTMALADLQHTMEIRDTPNVHEINPLLGEQPYTFNAICQFAITGFGYYLVNHQLEDRPIARTLLNVISFSTELCLTNLNSRAGLGKNVDWYVKITFEF